MAPEPRRNSLRWIVASRVTGFAFDRLFLEGTLYPEIRGTLF